MQDTDTPVEGASAAEVAPAAAPAQPAAPAVNVEELRTKLREELEQSFNQRVADFQRMVSERDNTIKQLQLSQLPEEERQAREIEEEEAYIASVELENWLLRMAQKDDTHRRATEAMKAIFDAEDGEAQLQVILGLLQAQEAARAADPEPEADVPDVDPNNPPATVGELLGRLPDGTPMTDQAVQTFLKNLGPDSLSKVRGQL